MSAATTSFSTYRYLRLAEWMKLETSAASRAPTMGAMTSLAGASVPEEQSSQLSASASRQTVGCSRSL